MDLVYIVQTLIMVVLGVGAYLYKDLKSKVEHTKEEFLTYKTHIAERYVSNDQLTKTIESMSKNIDNLAGTMTRIEMRLNNQIDNSRSTN